MGKQLWAVSVIVNCSICFWQSVLGYEIQKKGAPHNLDDASAAMKLVLAKIENGVDNAIPLVQEDVSWTLNSWWFLIPTNVILLIQSLIIHRYLILKWQSYFYTGYQKMCPLKNYIKSFLGTLQLSSRLSISCWYLNFSLEDIGWAYDCRNDVYVLHVMIFGVIIYMIDPNIYPVPKTEKIFDPCTKIYLKFQTIEPCD